MSTVKEILDEREERVKFQKYLIKKFNLPLIVLKANYPGVNKDNKLTRKIIEIMDKIFNEYFDYCIECRIIKFSCAGPIVFICLKENALDIKEMCINIEENHILGRCVDIDVIDTIGKSISRTELGYSMRKCFICDNSAHVCVRSKKHSQNQIVDFIQKRLKKYNKLMEHINNETF